MILWTLQSRNFFEHDKTTRIDADWKYTPANWRRWYEWMRRQWEARIGDSLASAPIWCWHSCSGVQRSRPTVGTFAMLMGDWSYYAPTLAAARLDVPDDLVLLSSYRRWNQAVDDAIDRGLDQSDDQFRDMFGHPLITNDEDDIQAVIPHIDADWITDMRQLPSGVLDRLDWDMPVTRFPKLPEQRVAP